MIFRSSLWLLAFFVVYSVVSVGKSSWEGQHFKLDVKGASYTTLTHTDEDQYDRNFGDDWQSVRTFRLVKPMSRPLLVYVDTRSTPLYKAHYMSYVTQSLNTWSSALDGRFSYKYTTDPKAADVTVNWVPAFEDRYTAGVTIYRVGHARVQIKTVGVPDKDIKANIMHEFGHALGIAGHSNNKDDIMVGMRRWQAPGTSYEPKLSQQDILAIQHLYSNTWSKGEDLYAPRAQKLALQGSKKNQASRMAVLNQQPAQPSTASIAIRLSPAEQRRSEDVVQYTQILPIPHR